MPLPAAPDGAVFEYREVKTAKGTKSLGQKPILVWQSIPAATTFYGEEGLLATMDGTSLLVSFQGTARRMSIQGKSDDEIAAAQLAFRPGKRAVGVSTPVSRAARAAKAASEKVSGDTIAAFLEKVAKGEISEDDLAGFVSV